MVQKTGSVQSLDVEWVKLILQAKGLGLKKEEIRYFLDKNRKDRKTAYK